MAYESPSEVDAAPDAAPRVPEWSEAARRSGESDEHHRWFRVYLGMAPADRHLADVATVVERSYSQVRKVSGRWHWRSRSLAWDREQRQAQGIGLREAATLGMTRAASAARTHSRTLEEVAASDGRAAPRDTATAIRTITAALGDIASYAADLEATTPLRPEVAELARVDPLAAWRAALGDMLTAGSLRPADLIGLGRLLLADPGADTDALDPAAFLRRVQLRLPAEQRAELDAAVRAELESAGADR